MLFNGEPEKGYSAFFKRKTMIPPEIKTKQLPQKIRFVERPHGDWIELKFKEEMESRSAYTKIKKRPGEKMSCLFFTVTTVTMQKTTKQQNAISKALPHVLNGFIFFVKKKCMSISLIL